MMERIMTLDEALAADGEKLRRLTGEDHGPFDIFALPPGFTFAPSSAAALATTRALLTDDDYAAGLVAGTVSLTQSTSESRPAFVKRIVRAWLEEMANA